ncbi:hypothetical protein R1A27_05920 [Methylobacterium sp. NMS12]|uniref:DUF6894 family protein n=1 Tax=Methylobacterium sp. NMS12 TaxID=3079766 RepID=UPI003F880E29
MPRPSSRTLPFPAGRETAGSPAAWFTPIRHPARACDTVPGGDALCLRRTGTAPSRGAPRDPLADPARGCDLPRFFLNVRRRGTLIADQEGDELPDRTAAECLAHDILRDMRRLPHVYGTPRGWRADTFVITDEAGAVVAEVPYDSVL